MTIDDKRPKERRLDDERCVDALLAEGGFPDDTELREVLLQLRDLRVADVPPPSPELAALLGQPAAAEVVHLEDWSRKHPRKRRAVFTTLAVAASLGVAGGAAAGNETLRSQAEGTISGIIRSFSPPAPGTPAPTTAPASPAEAPARGPAVVVPSPAGTPPPATVPTAPAPAPAADHSEREQQDTAKPPGHAPQGPWKAEAPSAVSPAGAKPAGPGASRAAELPGHRPPAGGPSDGKAKGKAAADGGTGQGASVSEAAPAEERR